MFSCFLRFQKIYFLMYKILKYAENNCERKCLTMEKNNQKNQQQKNQQNQQQEQQNQQKKNKQQEKHNWLHTKIQQVLPAVFYIFRQKMLTQTLLYDIIESNLI